jgi:hypothetical protein
MRKSSLRGWKYKALISFGAGAYTRTICPAFSLKELAGFLGMKVTPHFRRRVKELAREGQFIEQKVYAGNRGMQIVYYKPQNERLPF